MGTVTTLRPGLYDLLRDGKPHKAMFKLHGYTVFLMGQVIGVNVLREPYIAARKDDPKDGTPPGELWWQDGVCLRMRYGVAFCSPNEKRLVKSPDGTIIKVVRGPDYKQGFLMATGRQESATKALQMDVPMGYDIGETFRKLMQVSSLLDLSKMGVPDRVIEMIRGLHPWTYHTVREGRKVSFVLYSAGQRQRQPARPVVK